MVSENEKTQPIKSTKREPIEENKVTSDPDTPEPAERSKGTAQTRKDVRAGPGDAGASDRPERLPDNPQTDRRRREAGPLIVGFLIACAAAIIVVLMLYLVL